MSLELRGLLDNKDTDEEEGPFTDPSVASKKQNAEVSEKGNIITRNKITSLLLAIGIVLVLVISVVIIFFIAHNSGKKNATENITTNDGIIIAPLNDHRSYKVLVLPNNQLRVVLISDSNVTEAAAAMNVNAGSFNDPMEVDGLAHFCEHMLFLGTKKYPDKSEYSNFLSTNGGYDNAYTDMQNTNYYFSVNLDALEEALDRFAQFFIAPLFNKNSTFGEMKAVNSEYDKDFNSPGWKFFQLTKNVSNPQHPFSRFSIGSIETLNLNNITDILIKYYTSSYSANQV